MRKFQVSEEQPGVMQVNGNLLTVGKMELEWLGLPLEEKLG
jgi:hypothetical protein